MSLLTQASLVLTPNAYKVNKMYSIIPSSGSGDLAFTRATSATISSTRTNNSGVVENVANGVPRLDYSNSLTAPSWLLEPQRTNLATNSETFTGYGLFGSSLSSVALTNPSNGANSVLLEENTDNSAHFIFSPTVINYTVDNYYTNSIFVKKGNGANAPDIVQLSFSSIAFGSSKYANFNIVTGVITAQVGGTATIISLPNGWYRITFSAQCTVTTPNASGVTLFFTNNNATATRAPIYIGNVNSNVFVWGGQLEAGSYATSYIPTTTSTVTRNQDIMSKTNLYTNNFITSAGGTWFVELDNNFSLIRDAFGYGLFLNTLNTSTGNGFNFRNGSANTRLRINKTISGVDTELYITLTDSFKVAIKWNGATADVFVNGVKVVTSTAFTTTAMEFLNTQNNDVPKYIKSMILFPTPLTDAECISLTTL